VCIYADLFSTLLFICAKPICLKIFSCSSAFQWSWARGEGGNDFATAAANQYGRKKKKTARVA